MAYTTDLMAFIVSCHYTLGITSTAIFFFLSKWWRSVDRNKRTQRAYEVSFLGMFF